MGCNLFLFLHPDVVQWGEAQTDSWGENTPLPLMGGRAYPLSLSHTGYSKIQSYTVKVAATDYNQFAMVFFRKTSENKQYFKVTLYGGLLFYPFGAPGFWLYSGEGPQYFLQPQPSQWSGLTEDLPWGAGQRSCLLAQRCLESVFLCSSSGNLDRKVQATAL